MICSKPYMFAALAILSITLFGCGSGGSTERIPVSGTVTYQGQPVAKGEIRFQPIGNTKTSPSGATIKDGRYEVTARGGVPAGKFRVAITAFRPGSGAAVGKRTGGMGNDGSALIQYLPLKYNERSELTLSIEKKEDEKTADFELK